MTKATNEVQVMINENNELSKTLITLKAKADLL